MSESILLSRAFASDVALEGQGVSLVAEPHLGIAKLQILADDPDQWFESVLGIKAPAVMRESAPAPVACAWLAPGEWLVTGPAAEVEQVRTHCAEAAGTRGLMVDLTHARAAFALSGRAARTALAAHCPLDLSDADMPVGAAKRSLFSDTGVFISRQPDRQGQPCFRLIFDQTMAGYAARMLTATIKGNAL